MLYFHLYYMCFLEGHIHVSPFIYNRKILIPFIKLTAETYNNWLQVVIIRILSVIHYYCNVTIIIFMLSAFTLESEIFIVLCFVYFPTVIYYVCFYYWVRFDRLLLAFFIKIST